MTPDEFKIFENRLRRAAARQRLALTKSRRRDPLAPDYRTYALYDEHGRLVAGDPVSGYGLSLEQVEEELRRGRTGR